MEDLVTAKAGIVSSRPLHGVEYTAYAVQNSAQQQPEEARGRHTAVDGDNGKDGQPAHDQIDGAGQPAGDVQLGNGEDDACHRQRPDGAQQRQTALTQQYGQTDGGVAAGDEQIDGAVVIFPQGQPPGN